MYRISIISYQNSYICFIIHIINIGHKRHTYALYVTANCKPMSDMYHVSNVNHHIKCENQYQNASNVGASYHKSYCHILHQKQYEICIKYYKYCVMHAHHAFASSTAYSTSCVNVRQIYQTSYIAYEISHVKYQITYLSSIKHQTLCMRIPFICIHKIITLSTIP